LRCSKLPAGGIENENRRTAGGFLFSIAAQAQPYPNKPIRFVVPFPPGGNLDFVARRLQPKMQEVLGQPVLIDN
jgi:tripartite-type tricarboxylate transporter receptor subunit TctC